MFCNKHELRNFITKQLGDKRIFVNTFCGIFFLYKKKYLECLARSSSNWSISACIRHRLKGSGSSSFQTLLPQADGEGVSTAQASEAPSEVYVDNIPYTK